MISILLEPVIHPRGIGGNLRLVLNWKPIVRSVSLGGQIKRAHQIVSAQTGDAFELGAAPGGAEKVFGDQLDLIFRLTIAGAVAEIAGA